MEALNLFALRKLAFQEQGGGSPMAIAKLLENEASCREFNNGRKKNQAWEEHRLLEKLTESRVPFCFARRAVGDSTSVAGETLLLNSFGKGNEMIHWARKLLRRPPNPILVEENISDLAEMLLPDFIMQQSPPFMKFALELHLRDLYQTGCALVALSSNNSDEDLKKNGPKIALEPLLLQVWNTSPICKAEGGIVFVRLLLSCFIVVPSFSIATLEFVLNHFATYYFHHQQEGEEQCKLEEIAIALEINYMLGYLQNKLAIQVLPLMQKHLPKRILSSINS